MAKKQTSTVVDTPETIQQTLNLKSILEDIGIQVSDEQVEMLAARVVLKKTPRKSTKYQVGQIQVQESDKIPSQMRIALLNFEDGMTLNEWADRVALDTRFVTKQSPVSILAYYRKTMIDKGYIQPAI